MIIIFGLFGALHASALLLFYPNSRFHLVKEHIVPVERVLELVLHVLYQVGHQAELFAEIFVLLLHLHSDLSYIALLGLEAVRGLARLLRLGGIVGLESADLF